MPDSVEFYEDDTVTGGTVETVQFLEVPDTRGPQGLPGPGVRVWRTGDADPTEGGTVALPPDDFFFFILAVGDPVPSWAPVPSVTYRY